MPPPSFWSSCYEPLPCPRGWRNHRQFPCLSPLGPCPLALRRVPAALSRPCPVHTCVTLVTPLQDCSDLLVWDQHGAVSVCLVVLCPSEHLRLNRLCCLSQPLGQSACSRLETPSTVEPDWHLGRVMRGNRMRGKKRNLEPLGPPEGECAWSH